MEDLWRRSATDIAALVASRKLSATEVASAALARLDAVNPSINAVVDHRPDDVLAQAGAVDAALRRGESVGPLAGVPVTVKVNIDQQGFATTNGLKLQRDLIARSNSPVVDNLRKAGAVILGRTNCPAFSYRWFTTNLLHGDTKNPRDPGLTPGGSSGGAGAAVAAGIGRSRMAPTLRARSAIRPMPAAFMACARLSDASPPSIHRRRNAASAPRSARYRVRWRAAWAICGLRSRRCRPRPAGPLVGARTARRSRSAQAGGGVLSPRRAGRRRRGGGGGCRCGKRLQRAGWVVEEVETTPSLREAAEWQTRLWLGDGYEAQLANAEREGDPGALACLRGNRDKVFPFDAAAFSKTLTRRATLTRDWLMFFETHPVLLMPVSGELPFPDGLDRRDEASFARVWRAQIPHDRYSLHGAACANRLHGTGRPRSGWRSTGVRPLP